ncbi:MAG: hypothetical protein A3G25_16915 [Betaproteobacteria bacterium RIFCSPLOWO2_12_FULL_63_13]|nr:MAG: hypothetical protein A3G25_16915 [Betaproteobacteria bacterium RIFCSPLOWO2_12_FULL_63_13]
MEGLDYWRVCDELSVIQAALLMVGIDPSSEKGYAESWQPHERPHGYEAARTALINAVLSKTLCATVRHCAWERGWNEAPEEGEIVGSDSRHREIIYKAEPDWSKTTVRVDDLRAWLNRRGFKHGFFFPEATDNPDYLDPEHPSYAPKLAAAVEAWRVVSTDAEQTRGKSPKKAIIAWLRLNADKFGLTKDDGKRNELGIEEVAKIANWDTKGGAPKTPGV